jgi:hypothetical protein
MKEGMKVYTEDGDIAAVFYSVQRKGDKLIIDGKALDTMRMDMIFTAEEVLKGLRMVICWQTISFVLLLPYFYLRRNIFKHG